MTQFLLITGTADDAHALVSNGKLVVVDESQIGVIRAMKGGYRLVRTGAPITDVEELDFLAAARSMVGDQVNVPNDASELVPDEDDAPRRRRG